MTYFTRMRKGDRQYDGRFAATGTGAPPAHLRDRNRSHSGQGANASIPTQEGDLAVEQNDNDAPIDPDTTDQ